MHLDVRLMPMQAVCMIERLIWPVIERLSVTVIERLGVCMGERLNVSVRDGRRRQ